MGPRGTGVRPFLFSVALASGTGAFAAQPVPCPGGACGSRGGEVPFVEFGGATYYNAARGPAGGPPDADATHAIVEQATDRVILNWASFDVGAGQRLQFVQPSADAIALNRVHASQRSEIWGALDANGRIYLVNPNGILFGEGSSVDVDTLVATTLDLNDFLDDDERIEENRDRLFRELGILEAGTSAVFTDATEFFSAVRASGDGGDGGDAAPAPEPSIRVGAGAELRTNEDFRRILLIAPEVVNEGTIEAPRGQVMLVAAKDRVYLDVNREGREGGPLIGFRVDVGEGGTVTNAGSLFADQGNVTLLGLAVNQEGFAGATTSTRLRGSVRLLARDGATGTVPGPQATRRSDSEVTFGEGSVTTVVPVGDGALPEPFRREPLPEEVSATDELEQLASVVEAIGKTITVESGATLRSTGGDVDLVARETFQGNYFTNDRVRAAPEQPGTDDASLRIEDGAVVDVSGDDTDVRPLSDNVVEVELRSVQLADSPVQRDGPLDGATVRVDRRFGTPVADVSEAIEAVPRSVRERLAPGGRIRLHSQGALVVEGGATLDVSGGQVRYQDGFLDLTRLEANGQSFDITDADPLREYDAVASARSAGAYRVEYDKFGTQRTFYAAAPRRLPENGYVEGKDAGALEIVAQDFTMAGQVAADTVRGTFQRRPGTADIGLFQRQRFQFLQRGTPAYERPFDQVPRGGRVRLDLKPFEGIPVVESANEPRDVVLATGQDGAGNDAVTLDPTRLGFPSLSAFELDTYGAYEQLQGTDVTLAPGATYAVRAGRIDLDAGVAIPSGTVHLRTLLDPDLVQNAFQQPNAPAEIAGGAVIDLDGRWVNDDPTQQLPGRPLDPLFLDGGTFDLSAEGDALVRRGTVLSVNGGAWLASDGTLTGGDAGAIAVDSTFPRRGRTGLFATLSGFALEGHAGGRLAFTGNSLLIAGTVPDPQPPVPLPPPDGEAPDPEPPVPPVLDRNPFLTELGPADVETVISPGVFARGGFSDFAFTARGGVLDVAGDLDIAPVPTKFLRRSATRTPGGAPMRDVFRTGRSRRPVPEPVDIDLTVNLTAAPQLDLELPEGVPTDQRQTAAFLRIGTGTTFDLPIGSTVDLASNRQLVVDGAISAPSGTITATLSSPESNPVVSALPYEPNQAIWLGENARLDVSGRVVTFPNDLGLSVGEVTPGGVIRLVAEQGAIVAAGGSALRADGAAATLARLRGPGNRLGNVNVHSAGGVIDVQAADGIVLAGELRARAGGTLAQGGRLRVALDANERTFDVITFPSFVAAQADDADRVLRVQPTVALGPEPEGEAPEADVDPDVDTDPDPAPDDGSPPGPAAGLSFALGEDLPEGLRREALIGADTIASGGFDDLTLAARDVLVPINGVDRLDDLTFGGVGVVRFADGTDLSLPGALVVEATRIDTVGVDGLVGAGSAALAAGYVRLGSLRVDANDQQEAALQDPRWVNGQRIDPFDGGEGRLTVRGALVDLYPGLRPAGLGRLAIESASDIRLQASPEQYVTYFNPDETIPAQLLLRGDLELAAERVYPTTLSQYTIETDGRLTISGLGANASAPTSALGSVQLRGTDVQIGGRLFAPGGSIRLGAADAPAGRVAFGADALVSVALDPEQQVPVGTTAAFQTLWTFEAFSRAELPVGRTLLESGLARGIEIAADTVAQAEGATFDLRGGGAIYATEFVPGLGGSVDVLAGEQQPVGQDGFANPLGLFRQPVPGRSDPLSATNDGRTFVIVPGLDASAAPLDPTLRSLADPELRTLALAEGFPGVVEAGTYPVLPPGYGLLPGALLVTPVPGTRDLPADAGLARLDGLPVLSGRFRRAFGGGRSSSSAGFVLETRSEILARADYLVSTGDELLPTLAARSGVGVPRLLRDAASLSLRARESIRLDGLVAGAAAPGGEPGVVEVVADRLAVVADRGAAPGGSLAFLADSFDGLRGATVVLGGRIASVTTRDGVTTERLDVRADEVRVVGGATLSADRALLLARDRVAVAADAVVEAVGPVTGLDDGARRLVLGGPGATLLVSRDGAPLELQREAGPGSGSALLTIADGATVRAPGNLLLEATGDLELAGTYDAAGARLGVLAPAIDVGAPAPGAVPGAVLGPELLASLQDVDLVLAARAFGGPATASNRIAFTTDLDLDLGDVTLEAPRILAAPGAVDGSGVADGAPDVDLTARVLRLRGGDGGLEATAPGAEGTLALGAETLWAEGSLLLEGFQGVDLGSGAGLVVDRDFDLAAPGAQAFALELPWLRSEAAARFRIDAPEAAVRISAPATDRSRGAPGLGGRVEVVGSAVTWDLPLRQVGGLVDLAALDGQLVLGSGADVDVAGATLDFDRVASVDAAGGILRLSAGGALRVADGARVSVAGAGSAAGGRLDVRAGSISWNGEIGTAGDRAAGVPGARVAVVAAAAEEAGAGLLERLGAGFAGGIDVRLGGPLEVPAGVELAAERIALASDSDRVTVNGTLRATGVRPAVRLSGGRGVALGGDGRVLLEGRERAQVTFAGAAETARLTTAPGSLLDLGSGPERSVRFRLPVEAEADGEVGGIELGGTLANVDRLDRLVLTRWAVGPGDTDLDPEGLRDPVLTGADLTAIREAVVADLDAVGDGAFVFADGFVPPPGIQVGVRSALEVTSSTDLRLAEPWQVRAWAGAADLRPGELTLRAAGSLRLEADLLAGFDRATFTYAPLFFPETATTDVLGRGPSWSFDLVAGAEIGSADVLATAAPAALTAAGLEGHLVIDGSAVASSRTETGGVSVGTGTGDLSVVTAGDLELVDETSILFVAGEDLGPGTIPEAFFAPDPERTGGGGFGGRVRATIVEWFETGYFPENGGDLRLRVGGDLRTGGTRQLVTDWLVRPTGVDRSPEARPLPAYQAVQILNVQRGSLDPSNVTNNQPEQRFQQHLGSFGGGSVDLQVAGSIDGLHVSVPTTVVPTGPVDTFETDAGRLTLQPLDGTDPVFPTTFERRGGGDVRVLAGGDIRGGFYWTDRGDLEVRALGAIRERDDVGLIVGAGDGAASVLAGAGIDLAAAPAPTLLPRPEVATNVVDAPGGGASTDPGYLNGQVFFGRYTPATRLSLQSLAGNVRLGPDPDGAVRDLGALQAALNRFSAFPADRGDPDLALSILPAELTAAAVSGSLELAQSFTTAPLRDTSVRLLAGTDVTTAPGQPTIGFRQSDAPPSTLPTFDSPSDDFLSLNPLKPFVELSTFDVDQTPNLRAPVPVHAGDGDPSVVVALNGDVAAGAPAPGATVARQTLLLDFVEPVRAVAGGRFAVDEFSVQHNAPGDLSTIEAGAIVRPIRTRLQFASSQGAVASDELANAVAIEQIDPGDSSVVRVAGPGRLDVLSEGPIDLATSAGILSIGDRVNAALPGPGADLGVFAGTGPAPEWDLFALVYLADLEVTQDGTPVPVGDGLREEYRAPLLAYLESRGVRTEDESAPLTRFLELELAERRPFLLDVFFNELSQSGFLNVEDNALTLDAGRTAVDVLFPRARFQAAAGQFPATRITVPEPRLVPEAAAFAEAFPGVEVAVAPEPSPDELGQLGLAVLREGEPVLALRRIPFSVLRDGGVDVEAVDVGGNTVLFTGLEERDPGVAEGELARQPFTVVTDEEPITTGLLAVGGSPQVDYLPFVRADFGGTLLARLQALAPESPLVPVLERSPGLSVPAATPQRFPSEAAFEAAAATFDPGNPGRLEPGSFTAQVLAEELFPAGGAQPRPIFTVADRVVDLRTRTFEGLVPRRLVVPDFLDGNDLVVRQNQLYSRRLGEVSITADGVAVGPAVRAFEPYALFPNDVPRSDFDMIFSSVKTERGGGIDLVVPSGSAGVGVASTGFLPDDFKGPEDLGIITLDEGDVRAYVLGGFDVNESRVVAIDGGDVLLWSDLSNIDAGRGSKTAVSSAPPELTETADDILVRFAPPLAGSGIRLGQSDPEAVQGNVSLYAPAGIVDFGEAGVGGAGTIFVVAEQVANVANTDSSVQGAAIQTVNVAPVGAGDTAAAVADSATQAVAAAAASAGQDAVDRSVTNFAVLDVVVEGFGEEMLERAVRDRDAGETPERDGDPDDAGDGGG